MADGGHCNTIDERKCLQFATMPVCVGVGPVAVLVVVLLVAAGRLVGVPGIPTHT